MTDDRGQKTDDRSPRRAPPLAANAQFDRKRKLDRINRIIGIEWPSAAGLLAEGGKIFTPLNHCPGSVKLFETIKYCSGSLPISAEPHLTGAVNPVNPACPVKSYLHLFLWGLKKYNRIHSSDNTFSDFSIGLPATHIQPNHQQPRSIAVFNAHPTLHSNPPLPAKEFKASTPAGPARC